MAILKINNLNLHALTAAELFRQQEQFGITIDNIGAHKLKITSTYNVWKRCFQAVDDSINVMQKSLLTEPIADCKKECAKAFTGIYKFTKSLLNHYDPQVCAAAKNLIALFNNYGKITRLSMNEQISLTQNILQEFKGKFNSDVKKIGLESWIEHLEKSNNKLVELGTERFAESAQKSKLNLKIARKKLESAYKDICKLINAFVIMEGSSNYESFIRKINTSNAKFGSKSDADK